MIIIGLSCFGVGWAAFEVETIDGYLDPLVRKGSRQRLMPINVGRHVQLLCFGQH